MSIIMNYLKDIIFIIHHYNITIIPADEIDPQYYNIPRQNIINIQCL